MAKTYEQKMEQLTTLLNALDDEDIVDVHNHYCEERNNYDDTIYPNDDATLDEIMGDCSFSEAACKLNYSPYNYTDDYFWFNGYGNLKSSNDPRENIYIDDIARYIIEYSDSLGNDDIQDIIDEWDSEDLLDDDDDDNNGEEDGE